MTFYARGGQGAKSAAEIIAQAAVAEGKFVQAFPQFGPERTGAPTKTFVRVSDFPIRTHEPVANPDVTVVLDETILNSGFMALDSGRDGLLLVNSARSSQELAEKTDLHGKIHAVDANGISMSIIGQPRPNTVILGKIAKISSIVKLESITSEFRKIFEDKIGKEATDKNVEAIEKAYDII